MNENWPRWIYASVSKHFITNCPLIRVIEGANRENPAAQNFAEFRMDGPRITQLDSTQYRVWFAVNILVQTTMSENFHQHWKNIGQVVPAFTDPVEVYRLGDGPDDDQSLLGCFSLLQDNSNRLQVNNMGQIDPTVRLMQATIEGHYQTELTEEL